MKKRAPVDPGVQAPYFMRVADLLSDDPELVSFFGPHFKVVVAYDANARRVTYSFRRMDDTAPDEWDMPQV